MLTFLLATTVAMAAVLPVAPGRTVQVEQCTRSRRMRCWSRAQRLSRFVGESSTQWTPIHTDVRLIWEQHALMVRVANLPEYQQVELVVYPNGNTDGAKAQLITAGKGVTQHNLGPKPAPGQVRSARVMLRDTQTQEVRSWAPTGAGDLTRPTRLWFSETKKTIPIWAIESTENQWLLTSEDTVKANISHRRPVLPTGGKGVTKPWSATIKNGDTFPSPSDPGWYDITLSWNKGNHLRTTSAAIYWQPKEDPRVETLGIHPAPKSVVQLDGQAFHLNEQTKICAEGENLAPATHFFTAEVLRLTGISIDHDCTSDAAIRFGISPQEVRHHDGFAIQARETRLNLRANSAAGLMYGSQALADLLGLDGKAPSVDIVDWPTIERRILFHELPPKPGKMIDPKVFLEFFHSAVVRGRINTLIIDLKDGYTYASHPELSRPDAWTKKDLNTLLDAAKLLGVEVIPTVNTPGHASWITARHPELIEEGTNNLLCTRHPQTRVLIEDLYTELIDVFRQPKFLHIGHDEIRWRTRWKHEIQRCPRCEGTPRWALIEEDLLWNHSVLMNKGVRPMLWSDMLVQGWHGDWDGIYRTSKRIPDEIRPDFTIMSWGRNGDTVGTLVPMGYSVIRGSTGHADWKRKGLEPVAQGIAGEAIALFYATPWSSFGGGSGPTNLHHHWSQVILSGATAWRPDIANTPIYANLTQLRNHPAYLPGLQQWAPNVQFQPLRVVGEVNSKHDIELPGPKTVNGVPFSIRSLVNVTKEEPVKLQAQGIMNGISVLQGIQYDRSKEALLIKAHHKTPQMSGLTVGEIIATYEDGSTDKMPIILGQSTERTDRPVPATLLWKGGGVLTLPSVASAPLAPHAQDRALYRIDWHNPRPEVPIAHLHLRANHADVTWMVAAVTVAR
jgi:hypothetical protein